MVELALRDRLAVHNGDIAALDVDVIVNAANLQLAGGGGVDGAIHRAAGLEQLQAACRQLDGCPTGDVRVTPGFGLKAQYIFHTVGPVWHGGGHGEPEQLASCYRTALQLARQYNAKTLAFPAISCGVYGYPADQAVACAVDTVVKQLQVDDFIEQVVFCCFSDEMSDLYLHYLKEVLSHVPVS